MSFPVISEKNLNDRYKFDLIIQLKQRKIIDEYEWFILFDNKYAQGDEVINLLLIF